MATFKTRKTIPWWKKNKEDQVKLLSFYSWVSSMNHLAMHTLCLLRRYKLSFTKKKKIQIDIIILETNK